MGSFQGLFGVHGLLVGGVLTCCCCGLQAETPQPGAVESTSGAAAAPQFKPLVAPGASVAVIKIEGIIYGFTFESLQSRVELARERGASLIVVELDTPGGLVDSALKISKYLKSLDLPTLAWVNPHAYSAGVMIAAACDGIVMSPSSATGDCAPIVPGVELAPTERAKALSPILEEFRDSATANGYEYVLFHAMAVLGVEVYQVKDPATGRQRLVNQADYGVMVRGEPLEGGWLKQLLSQRREFEVGGPTVEVATEADRGKWELVQKIHDGRTLLTLNQTRALQVGLSRATVRGQRELEEYLQAASFTSIEPSRVEMVAYWLTHPLIRTLLIVAMVLGAYFEMQVPGFGLGGVVALAALALLLIAPFLVGLAQVWHILLFVAGAIMLIIEVFVTPGFGILGTLGIIAMFTGLILMTVPTDGRGPIPLPGPEMAQRLRDSVLFTLLAIVVSAVGIYFLTKYLGVIPVLNRLVLKSLSAGAGSGAGAASTRVSGDEVIGRGTITVGAKGRTVTELRPSGRARFGDQIVDVISLGEWIQRDRVVKVIEVHGNRIVVDLAEA